MMYEAKCVQWKRQGAEQVNQQISGLCIEQELAFWQEQTAQLKLLQVEKNTTLNKAIKI